MPETLSPTLLNVLVCPEDRTPVRLATPEEITGLNTRIAEGSLKRRSGAPVTEPLDAVLIRVDGRVGYEVQDGIPLMLMEEGLALDPEVGPPQINR